jgi:glutamate-ammonia-ligase adenylyltransferase
VAGDLGLGHRVVGEVHAAMRDRLRSLDLPGEIRSMRRRLERNADHPGGEGAVDLKRDPGGIIDIEFLVQRAQLECLRDDGTAPEVNTASALGSLAGLTEENATALRRHLLTLRTLECQLRLLQASRSSSIPADAARWRDLAVAHLGPRATAEELRTHLEVVRKSTRAHFDHAMSG